ncbi:uncharacterized protein LOC133864846 [Alnus glutinosa]|uniref:uncharacterized protein LOC133864846 n=1 Tax=Alnus glutinosa TaxID=3517 RepID=UPI002D7669CB|nr:uncharacterized protein LOC133864846 [Alnus glutinosa]
MDENYRKKVVVVMMILIIPTLALKVQADDDRFPPLHPSSSPFSSRSSSTPSPSAPLSPSRLVGDGISKTKSEEICRRKCVAICLMKVVKDKSFEFFNYYYDGCMYECKTGQKDRRSKPPGKKDRRSRSRGPGPKHRRSRRPGKNQVEGHMEAGHNKTG